MHIRAGRIPAESEDIMQWIELNNGNLVDLEKVCCIEIDERVIVYQFVGAESCAELFELPSEAQKRMEYLKRTAIRF